MSDNIIEISSIINQIVSDANNILNIPLPAGTDSREYLNAYEHVLKKLN